MKNINQIRESYNLITEKEEAEDRKLATLVRAGLYDAKKLPALKKALEKSADKMTGQEKRMLLNLLDSLIGQVVSSDQVYRKVKQNVQHMNEAKEDYLTKFDPRAKPGYPSDRDIPTVLILKRKAIRVYPDNQKVALYYSQALDKYVTVPFSDIQVGINEAKTDDEDDLDKRLRRNTVDYRNVSDMLKAGKTLSSKRGIGYKYKKLAGGSPIEIAKRVKKDLGGNKYSNWIAAGTSAGTTVRNLVKNSTKKAIQTVKLNKALAKRKDRQSMSNFTPSSAPIPEPLARKTTGSTVPEVSAAPQQSQAAAPTKSGRSRSSKSKATTGKVANRPLGQVLKKMAKNPDVSQGAINYVNKMQAKAAKPIVAKEEFYSNLQYIREQRQLEEGKVGDFVYNDLDDFSAASIAKDFTPGIGTARAAERTRRAWKSGSYGSAALNALDTALSGVSDAALATGIGAPVAGAIKGASAATKGAVKGVSAGYKAYKAYRAAKAAKKADDVVDATKAASKADNAVDATKASKMTAAEKEAARRAKLDKLSKASGPKKRGWGSAIARGTGKTLATAGRIGARVAAGAVAGASSDSSDSHILSKSSKPEFGKNSLLKTASSFDDKQNQSSAVDVQNKKIARQANAAQANVREEKDDSHILSKSVRHTFNPSSLFRTKSSKDSERKPKNTQDVLDLIRQRKANQAQAQVVYQREDVVSTLKDMIDNNVEEQTLSINEQEININNTVAKKIMHVYESVNSTNKKKMKKMMNESAESFTKVLTFAIRQ